MPRPKEAPSSIAARMRQAIDKGEFAEALALAEGVAAPSAEVMLLHAYLLTKSDPAAAIALVHLVDETSLPRRRRIEAFSLLGTAYMLLRDYALAQEYFDRAHAVSSGEKATSEYAELLYRQARCYLFQQNIDDAQRLLAELRVIPSDLARTRALQLQSTVAQSRERYVEQSGALARLLERIDESGGYTEVWAWSLHTLSALARELYLPEARATVERLLDRRPWPKAFSVNRFQALKAIGWAQALQGDYFNGFRHLKAAADAAPSAVWRVMALLDRASLARSIGEPRWSRQELAEAESLAQTIAWNTVAGEERIALLLLAELLAPIDAGRAAYYAALHSSLRESSSPLHHDADERLEALANYASGVVQLRLGHVKAGVRLLRESFAVYNRIGYDWRAGLCALHLYAETHEPQLLNVIQEKLKHYMSCWLGDMLRNLPISTQGKAPRLTPVQTKIFHAICDGRTTAEIAAMLGRSEYTVRNHVKLILKAFGVKSRALLPAEAARWNLR